MKTGIVTTAAILLLSSAAFAQSGKIVFNERIKMQPLQVEGIDSMMLAAFPTEHQVKKELLFNEKEAIYRRAAVAPVKENELMEGQPNIVISIDEPDDKVYTDFKQKKVVEQRDFMSRLFLIEKPLEVPKWKLTGAQRTILGYVCQEAFVEDSLSPMKIWFAPQIAVQSGPGAFNGFPGMVLGVEMDNGNFTLIAVEMELSAIAEGSITRPTEGKKITEQKFREIVDEKNREMQEQYGGDGHTVIRVIHD